MKKITLAILVFLLTLLLTVTSFAIDDQSLPEKCEHCGVAVTWTPLSQEEIRGTSALGTGHYYVAMEEDISDSVVKNVNSGMNVCLYLNGKTLAGTTRALNVKSGATLNIMGEGKITGRGTTAGVDGACCYVEAGGTVNQYGGILTYVTYMQRHAVNGGVVYTSGTYNLYGGVIENGITKQYNGGNVYVNAGGQFNMYDGEIRNGTAEYAGGNMYVHATGTFRFMGGSISGGTAKVAGDSVYNRGTTILSGNGKCNNLFLNSDTTKGGPALADMVLIRGNFSGDINVMVNAPAAGMDIGNAENGTISGRLAILNAMLSAQVQNGNIILLANAYCEHCKTTVIWKPLEGTETYLADGHYFAENNISGMENKYVLVNRNVCVNLNGKTVTANMRAFTVYPGGTLNIMGEGSLVGRGSNEKYPNGGTINVVKDGTANLYSGTLGYTASEDTSVKVTNGAVVNIVGQFNMYGGTISGGVASNAGGAVFVEETGVLNVSGGSVEMGLMGTANSCIYNRGTVILSGDPVIADLYQKPNVSKGGPELGDMLVIRDVFSGNLTCRASGVTLGTDLGNFEGVISDSAILKIANSTANKLRPLGNDIVVTKGTPVLLYLADGSAVGFNSLAEAITAATADDRIVLFSDITESVELTKDIRLDLNGHVISGSLTGGKSVVCSDTFTDDYTVADGIYGTITSGDYNLIPAEGYYPIEKGDFISLHRLSFDISQINLRPSETGLYLTAVFAGDEILSVNIESFGIALNASDEPLADNMQTTSLYSVYSSDMWVTGQSTTATGTMLRGIMDPENSIATNQSHAQTLVYGKAYIKTTEGYLFSDLVIFDLRSFLEEADTVWPGFNGDQKKSAVNMFSTYADEMEDWAIPNLKQEKNNQELYASMDVDASDEDTALLNGFYIGTNAYHGELHDHASTGGRSDGTQPLDVWLAYMEYLDMDFSTIVDHKQVRHMYLDEWQSGMFIGGTEAATTVKELQMSMHYNMIFTDPEALIEILREFPEFNYTGGDPLTAYFPYYPSLDRARLAELITAIREKGGMFTQVHPTAGSYIQSDDPLDYWFADWTGLEVVSTYHTTRDDEPTQKNYDLWVKLLALGKKVWATAGSDEHDMPTNKALSTVYATDKQADAYFEQVRVGNFNVGPVGIRMCVGDTFMGSEGSFAGARVVFSVGDFHQSVYEPGHTYRVDLISNEGVVFSQEISCDSESYFAVEAQNVMFYRVEVWDTAINSRLSIGNPVWNTDYTG